MADAPNPPRENLVRALGEAPELVRSEGAEMPVLRGHFAVWDTPTEIRSAYEGHFIEKFAPGSMTKTLSEARDRIKVLFQHGKDPQIADKPLGPIARLEPDSVGAYYEVPMLDTSYNRDLIPGLEANLYGASFRFQVISEEFNKKPRRSEHNPNGIPERTVTEAKVVEFGPVTFPAYREATAGLRSMTDEFIVGRFTEDPERLLELIRAAMRPEPTLSVSFSNASVTGGDFWSSTSSSSSTAQVSPPADEASAGEGSRAETEPEPSEATTPQHETVEPEPSEATTRSSHVPKWFVKTPDPKRSK